MTKITAFAAATTLTILLSTGAASAQEAKERRIEVVGYGGVGFTGDLGISSDTQSGNVSFDSAPVYGGLVGFRAQPNGYAYLSYSRMETTAYFRPSGGFDPSHEVDVTFDYFQVGGNLEAKRGRFVPYLGLSIGATRMAAVDGGEDFSFSGVLDGGLKIMLLDFLDVRVIGRMPVNFVTGEAAALCVGGAGCLVRYSGQPLLQGQFLLGVGVHL